MTHAQRNEAISRKITAYTERFAGSQKDAKSALEREGFVQVRDRQKPSPRT